MNIAAAREQDSVQPAVAVHEGDSPLILASPHAGTWLPEDVFARLNETGRRLADTDWHVNELYAGLAGNATRVQARFHRYLIDANRPPDGHSLYPGQNTTGLCPLVDFDNTPIWKDGEAPDADEIGERLRDYHAPYHGALHAQIQRTLDRHGVAIVYDCHSIRSRAPFLFEGELPVLNVGTDGGRTCAPTLQGAVVDICSRSVFSHVLNGRFRGGWTTRHYGHPEAGVHAVQMELAQRAYLAGETPPFDYDAQHAEPLREVLAEILAALEDHAQVS